MITQRRWLAPEVVQTSSMDCGPAALKCLLEGFGVPVSYGRLREACQTSVDGTSIDTIEDVAVRLGLDAEQVLIPADHVALAGATLPAIAVVRHADEATHFVVVWRRHRGWLQVMDPAIGRRWVRETAFRPTLYRHGARVAANDWLDWVRSDACVDAWRDRLAAIGCERDAGALIDAATTADWRAAAALDAAIRLTTTLVAAGAVAREDEAARLVAALVRGDPTAVPATYWTVAATDDPEEVVVTGAVLVTVAGAGPADFAGLPPELAAALAEPPAAPLRTLARLLREDGVTAPLALALAAAIAAGALMLEALLFRGLLDVGARLTVPIERVGAAAALLVFMAVLVVAELAMAGEALRQGRAIEVRLRAALLAKLPRLADRYFQSRPISDMADRSHNIHAIRAVPSLTLQFAEAVFELILTATGIALVAPGIGVAAFAVAALVVALPLVAQPLLNERDLRVRNHAGALHGFYLDAILGLAPIRAHRAQRNVQRLHEGLLVEWCNSIRGLVGLAVTIDGVLALIGIALAIGLVAWHFGAGNGVGGADLLLVFWVLKLPGLGAGIAGLAQRYPAQRNALLRLVEPLGAPEEESAEATRTFDGPVAIALHGVDVVAGGHSILTEVDLGIAPGEHIAIVGASGAGKSSLLGLLLGLHRAAAGEVRIDGEALAPGDLPALRRATAWVDPAIQIWNRSLLDNLLYAAGDDAAWRTGEVIAAARLRGVARQLPDGLQTLLGEGGALLSGGEGQRVRLGRALAMPEPGLVLLDEPFRGLERGQRRALLDDARVWWRGATLLCVTHDIAETRDFDRVIVIEDGRLIEDGAPAALATAPSRYRALLEAEADVQAALWSGSEWRRLRLEDGRIYEAGRA